MKANLPFALAALFVFRVLPVIAGAALCYLVATDVWQWATR